MPPASVATARSLSFSRRPASICSWRAMSRPTQTWLISSPLLPRIWEIDHSMFSVRPSLQACGRRSRSAPACRGGCSHAAVPSTAWRRDQPVALQKAGLTSSHWPSASSTTISSAVCSNIATRVSCSRRQRFSWWARCASSCGSSSASSSAVASPRTSRSRPACSALPTGASCQAAAASTCALRCSSCIRSIAGPSLRPLLASSEASISATSRCSSSSVSAKRCSSWL